MTTEMSFFKESKGIMPPIYNGHSTHPPKQCPECGGGLIRKRISDTRKDLVCALCGALVDSLVKPCHCSAAEHAQEHD